VEETLKQHPAVFDAAVVGDSGPDRDHAIKAYVILKEGAAATADQLTAWCGERSPPFKVPEVRGISRRLPRTSVGKLQKQSLQEGQRMASKLPLLYTHVMGSHGFPGWFWTALDKIKADEYGLPTSGRPSTTPRSSPSATRSARAST